MEAISPVGADLARIYATAEFQLGARACDSAGGEHVFCSFAGVSGAKDWVSIDEAHAAAQLTTAGVAGEDGQRVGVAQAAQTAASFGWVRVYGPETGVNVAANAAANATINTTAIVGRADDDNTAGSFDIVGAVLTTAAAANAANADLNYPRTSEVVNP